MPLFSDTEGPVPETAAVASVGLPMDEMISTAYPTAIGPVDLLCRDGEGMTVAVKIKRAGESEGANFSV